MSRRNHHDGRKDGLRPLKSLSLDQARTVSDLVRGMADTAFSGRQLGQALDVALEMARDEDCRVVLTVSGAMTVAKQGQIFCDLIERGLVHAVIATGALMAHGLTEALGMVHYRYDSSKSDEELYARGYNRVYDTLEMESNLDHVEHVLAEVLDNNEPPGGVWSAARLCQAIGQHLSEADEGPGILRSAYEKQVPVFIPAFTDSELGLDFAIWAQRRSLQKRGDFKGWAENETTQAVPPFNPFLDLLRYAVFAGESKRLGILTIGGGVPRNWAQQIGPFYDIANSRLGLKQAIPRFRYGIRICPEPVHWGGLSGCTYSEGVSWGKFLPGSEGGRYAEVYADATVALPILVKALFEELDQARP